MSRHPQLYQWIDTVVMRLPSLSKPQALGLALWSFGVPEYKSIKERQTFEQLHADLRDAIRTFGLARVLIPDNEGYDNAHCTNF